MTIYLQVISISYELWKRGKYLLFNMQILITSKTVLEGNECHLKFLRASDGLSCFIPQNPKRCFAPIFMHIPMILVSKVKTNKCGPKFSIVFLSRWRIVGYITLKSLCLQKRCNFRWTWNRHKAIHTLASWSRSKAHIHKSGRKWGLQSFRESLNAGFLLFPGIRISSVIWDKQICGKQGYGLAGWSW